MNTNVDFWIEEWRIRPLLNRMEGKDEAVQVEPRIMAVLLHLANHAGDVVTREELLETVWADVEVGDDPLNRAISELRKHFGDNPRRPQYIETIRQRGYRLIAPVSATPPAYLGDGLSLSVAPATTASPSPTQRPPTAPVSSPSFSSSLHWLIPLGLALFVVFPLLFLGWYSRPSSPQSSSVSLRPVPFTSYPGREYGADWAPDGNRLAFAWENTVPDGFNIFVKVPSSDTPQQITEGGSDFNPVWSPDGQQLAFIRTADGCEVFVVSATGGRARPLTPCASHRHTKIDWSPTSEWIAFVEEDAGPPAIALFNPTTHERLPLTTPPPGMTDGLPTFSPDGLHVVFVRSTSLGLDNLFRVAVAGGEPEQLTDENQRIAGASWEEADEILYASDRDGAFGIWALRLSGSQPPRWLLTGGDGVQRPSFNAATRQLVYQQHILDKNIWRVSLDTQNVSAPTLFTASTRWDLSPAYSPDGSQVVFMSTRSGSYEIWLADADGANAMQLTHFGGPFVNTPRWSPDGSQILFDARLDGNADIYVIEANGGPPRRITTHPAADIAATWSPDGQALYVTTNRRGVWEIWEVSLAEGDDDAEFVTAGYAPRFSPDQQSMYYTKHNERGLWRRDLQSNEETLVTNRLPKNEWGSWHLVADDLYFIETADDDQTLLVHSSLNTGHAVSLGPLPVHNPGISISPDGQHLLFVQVDRNESDLMQVTLP